MDKQKAPQSLDDLLQDGYLKSIPEDPFTHARDTWVTDSSDALYSLDQTEPASTTSTPAHRKLAPTASRTPVGRLEAAVLLQLPRRGLNPGPEFLHP